MLIENICHFPFEKCDQMSLQKLVTKPGVHGSPLLLFRKAMLHVLACCLELLCSSKPVKLLATCTEMDATTLYIVGRQCWESLRLFACSLKGTDYHKQVLSACLAMTKLSVAICSENLMNLQRCPGLN